MTSGKLSSTVDLHHSEAKADSEQNKYDLKDERITSAEKICQEHRGNKEWIGHSGSTLDKSLRALNEVNGLPEVVQIKPKKFAKGRLTLMVRKT